MTSTRAGVVAVCSRAEVSSRMSKPPVTSIVLDVAAGVVGDVHSGWGERQVAVITLETIEALAAQVGRPLGPGAMGENLVIAGVPAEILTPGGVLEFASGARIEVTAPRTPCVELEEIAPGLLRAAVGHCGFFARVSRGGPIAPGDPCRLLSTVSIT